jgi:hypothetical protein
VLDVVDIAPSADIDVLSGLDKHVISRDYIRDRRLAGILAGDPDRDGNVVRGLAIGDGEEAVDAEQQLGTPVIESWLGRQSQQGIRYSKSYCRHRTWDAGC